MKLFKILVAFSLLCSIVPTQKTYACAYSPEPEHLVCLNPRTFLFLLAPSMAVASYYTYKGAKRLLSFWSKQDDTASKQYSSPNTVSLEKGNPDNPSEYTQRMLDVNKIMEEIEEAKQYLPAIPDDAYGYLEAYVLSDDHKLASIGDLHGDWGSLNRNITHMANTTNLLTVEETEDIYAPDVYIKPKTKLILTGDYIDRGSCSIGVLRTLMHMLIDNPQQLYLLRGNHESRRVAQTYGFYQELQRKFGDNAERLLDAFESLFRRLPSALIIGMRNHQTGKIDYIKYIHAGLEVRLAPQLQTLLAKAESSPDGHAIVPFTGEDIQVPTRQNHCALQWGDFWASEYKESQRMASPRGIVGIVAHNKASAGEYLKRFDAETHTIACVVCGHRHTRGGVARLNDMLHNGQAFAPMAHMQPQRIQTGDIFTLTSSPAGLGGLCKEDAYMVIENTADGLQLTPYIQRH